MKNDQSRLVRIDAGPMKNPVPGKPRRPISGDAAFRTVTAFEGNAGKAEAGVWESTPGKWRVRYSENEFCHITRGRIRIQHESGRSWSFGVGASFVIPAGFSGVWEVLEPTSKLYVIYEPA